MSFEQDSMAVYDQYEDYLYSGYDSGFGSSSAATTTSTTARSRVVNYVQNIRGDEEVVPGGMTTIFVLVSVSVLCIIVFLVSCVRLFRRRSDPGFAADLEAEVARHMSAANAVNAPYVDPDFSAAIQNRHFMSPADKEMSCLNCRLIEMGSMACYQELCPQCGRPPPR